MVPKLLSYIHLLCVQVGKVVLCDFSNSFYDLLHIIFYQCVHIQRFLSFLLLAMWVAFVFPCLRLGLHMLWTWGVLRINLI